MTSIIKFEERDIKFDDDSVKVNKYNPIFEQFSEEYKSDTLILNYDVVIKSLRGDKDSYNRFKGYTEEKKEVPIFIKFCPLVDPIKIMVGKIEGSDFSLPKLNDSSHEFSDKNNSAFVDGFFSYLTSKLKNKYGFINGLDCYGSFLSIKKNFRVDILDDIEYLFESNHFMENKDKFNISESIYEHFQPTQSCKFKKKLNIKASMDLDIDILDIDEIDDDTILLPSIDQTNAVHDLVYTNDIRQLSRSSKSGSSCSSRSSTTTIESDYTLSDVDSDLELDSDEDSRSSSIYSCEEESIIAELEEMPTNMVLLEDCKDTLDDYIMNNKISEDEWSSILMQIVISLSVFQEKFYFIHNDLHSSNVMYVETDKQYLYYKYNNLYYKVPTYGKVWKIIDFGRGIYKLNGHVIFSDSFSDKGDASTQYNCEPYLNANKQIVPPNFSFDLCRLACSLYDYFEEENDLDNIKRLIETWLTDYKGRNILYKKNGDERYEDFKLYKMISRTVHDHVPKKQLSNKLFSQYLVSRKNIKKKMNLVMNIDDIPDLTV